MNRSVSSIVGRVFCNWEKTRFLFSASGRKHHGANPALDDESTKGHWFSFIVIFLFFVGNFVQSCLFLFLRKDFKNHKESAHPSTFSRRRSHEAGAYGKREPFRNCCLSFTRKPWGRKFLVGSRREDRERHPRRSPAGSGQSRWFWNGIDWMMLLGLAVLTGLR